MSKDNFFFEESIRDMKGDISRIKDENNKTTEKVLKFTYAVEHVHEVIDTIFDSLKDKDRRITEVERGQAIFGERVVKYEEIVRLQNDFFSRNISGLNAIIEDLKIKFEKFNNERLKKEGVIEAIKNILESKIFLWCSGSTITLVLGYVAVHLQKAGLL